MITLQRLSEQDLSLVRRWMQLPHVARWWLADTTVEAEMAPYPARIRGAEPTRMFLVNVGGRPIGWCQYYRWADYPAEAAALGPDLGQDHRVV